MKDIRIAAAIVQAPMGDKIANLRRIEKWTEKAADQGAQIICFPELNITGYSSRPEIRQTAESLEGPLLDAILEQALKFNATILAGFAEKGPEQELYASHAVIGPGGLLGIYRKSHLAPPEKDLFRPADDIPLFRSEGVTFGVQLCYDAHFPGLTTRMAGEGADIIFMPHASPRGTPREKLRSWMRHLPARAYDNSVFVVACNQTGSNGTNLHFPGVAVVIDPSGEIIQHKLSRKEGLLVTTLKARDLQRVRSHRMRYFLPHQRPELYS